MSRQNKIDELIKQSEALKTIQDANNDNQDLVDNLVESAKVKQLTINKQNGIDSIIKGIKKN